MGFVSQDGPEELARIKGRTEEPVRRRGEEFARELEELAPAQLDALVDFAARVYRRPLAEAEQDRAEAAVSNAAREERNVARGRLAHDAGQPVHLAAVSVSRRIGSAGQRGAAGFELGAGDAAELFPLGDRCPTPSWNQAAAAGTLTDPAVLSAQTSRMLQRRPRSAGWRPSLPRSGCTSATFATIARRTKSCFPRSTIRCARRCSRNRPGSSRTCFKKIARCWKSSTPTIPS